MTAFFRGIDDAGHCTARHLVGLLHGPLKIAGAQFPAERRGGVGNITHKSILGEDAANKCGL